MFTRISDYCYEIPVDYKPGMNVPGRIYASADLFERAKNDKALDQVAHAAFLPGIVGYSLAMPDIHWGYGFPIGGCAATDPDHGGVISPAGVGYDINCGVRLLRTDLTVAEAGPGTIEKVARKMFNEIPSGVGRGGNIKVHGNEARSVMTDGSAWAVSRGFGDAKDLECTEEHGSMADANPDMVSPRAFERGASQLGTLGSGNHFLELQEVETIYDQTAAGLMGLFPGQLVVMIHSGSRGFGYQVCDDYVKSLRTGVQQYHLPDKQLACARFYSSEGQDYFNAMKCAANYAWANRQVLMHLVRLCFEKQFGKSYDQLGMRLVYDVAHNIAKLEMHTVAGELKQLCVHRKGATRAFGPNHPDVPDIYKPIGQPVIIPGDMGRASYVLTGTAKAMTETFGTTCHGAGRVASRTAALKSISPDVLLAELKEKGIVVLTGHKRTIVEEAPQVYKNVDDVVAVVEGAGISKKVCRMRPLAVIKG